MYKHIKLLSHYSNISNNEFDIPSIIFERFAYRKRTPKAYISRNVRHCFESLNSYFERLNSYFESLNSYFESLNSYFETVADTGGGGRARGARTNLCCLGASGTRKHTNI